MDITQLTLGQLITVRDETIKRNAMSIVKTLQKKYAFCPHCRGLDLMKHIEYCGDGEYFCTNCA